MGNTQIDQMLVNLKLMGIAPWDEQDLTKLKQYCQAVSRATGVPIPANYPVVGDDAFRTATGVHAAAIIKAYRKNDVVLANTVYSGVPSHVFGLEQIIDIGPMSGKSNVLFWLERRGIPATDDLVERIYLRAKASDHTLSDAEIVECLPAATRRIDDGDRNRMSSKSQSQAGQPKDRLRHAILGAGGVGGLIGACLAHAGDSVTLVVRREALAQYPKQLHLESPFGNFTVDVAVAAEVPARRRALDYGEGHAV